MNVITVAKSVTVEPAPGVTAGQVGAAIAAVENIAGEQFTLKANGLVLEPSDIIDGLDVHGDVVWELVEHVPTVAAPEPATEVEAVQEPIVVGATKRPAKPRTEPADAPADS